MRATIKFEVDVDQVENTMALLIAMEADTLRAIADMVDVSPGPRTMVLEEVTEALHQLQKISTQFYQYQQMLASFERARFETVLPQPVATAGPQVSSDAVGPLQQAVQETADTAEQMQQFNQFLSRIQEQATATTQDMKPGEGDGNLSEEG